MPFTERAQVPARTVVIVTYNHPNREPAEYLGYEPGPWNVHLVGDVTGTNGIRPAIHQAPPFDLTPRSCKSSPTVSHLLTLILRKTINNDCHLKR